jgi:KipI family sensor histidine kinase inhibitor
MQPKIVPLGDSSLLIELGEEIDLVLNRRVHALSTLIESAPLAGISETVPAYATLVVHYDPAVLTCSELTVWLHGQMDRAESSAHRAPRQVEVSVRYGGASGPDLEPVAASKGISPADVTRLHTGRSYTVFMMGFTPGFPYMGTLDERLRVPRLGTPRTLVKAGTVAIAGEQTGIYPLDSPGGWQLIGWTPLKLFDAGRDEPFLFMPADEVHFVPVEDFDA